MSNVHSINEFVRRRLRQLRLSKRLKMRQIAERAGIPVSSYACMESGQYRINLDSLFRVLGVLDADIHEVWPVENLDSTEGALYVRRVQEFRLAEVISLSGAEGAALFRVAGGRCRLLLAHHLSDFLLDRLILYLEEGRRYDKGLWFERRQEEKIFTLFLKAEQCPAYLGELIRQYLSVWVTLFSDDSLLFEASESR